MSRLELLKLLVQPVVLERDDEGTIIGEQLGQPQPLYTLAELADYWQAIEQQLQEANTAAAAVANGDDSHSKKETRTHAH